MCDVRADILQDKILGGNTFVSGARRYGVWAGSLNPPRFAGGSSAG